MMNRTKGLMVIVFLIGIISGCRSRTYNHSALCSDRDVTYCEDFESISSMVNSISLAGTDWFVTSDHWLSSWNQVLPADGRSPESFISVGFESQYLANSESLLLTPSFDLSNATEAVLRFNLLFMTEPKWDGMILIATQNKGETWMYLSPDGEYSSTVKAGRNIVPGYSGLQPYWSHEEVDLAPFLGSEVSVGFLFLADDSINNIGMAIDDIVIEIKSTGYVAQSGFKAEFPGVNSVISQDLYIGKEIPNTIAVLDTPCEGAGEEVLKESQIAYTKAINPSGERYLILHPESGNYCWVRGDDVWIDGEESTLPELSDIRKEDRYLPFCSLHQTPVIDNPACLFSPEDSSGELSYQITNTLIETGRISAILIEPSETLAPEPEVFDPRIAAREALPAFESMRLAAGNLMVTINNQEVECSFDSHQPGRIVCDNLDLDSADAQEIVMCWTGGKESQGCPPGYCSATEHTGCYLIGDSENCSYICPQGYLYSEELKVCLINRDPAILSNSPELCSEGYKNNTEAECCLTPTMEEHYTCPDGFAYLPKQGACQRMAVGEECPEGFTFDQGTGTCFIVDDTLPSICAVIEMEFPQTLVTVKNSTSCRRGPGKEFENVSSLAPFSEAEVLGIDEEAEFLIINNPKYQIPCWAPLDDFYSDKLNLDILSVIRLTSEVE